MSTAASTLLKPVQVTLWDLLGETPTELRRPPKATALPATDRFEMIEPTLQEKCFVHEALAEALPPGTPIYAKMIMAVYHPGKDRIIADVKLFDDAVGRVEISGPKGGHCYRWHHCGVPGTAFHWVATTRTWKRIPEES